MKTSDTKRVCQNEPESEILSHPDITYSSYSTHSTKLESSIVLLRFEEFTPSDLNKSDAPALRG